MAWIVLVIAGLLEIVWAFSMKQSDGFTRPAATVVTVLAMIVSFALLSLAINLEPGPDSRTATFHYAGAPASGVEPVLAIELQDRRRLSITALAWQAGVLAGQLSASRTVGVVTGPETPPVKRYRDGFANGVASVCRDCQVIEIAIDSAADAARGKTAALSQIAEGADIIFGVGGQTGSGAVLGATQDDAWAIGADVDEYWTTFDGGATEGAGRLLTSAVKRADVAVGAAIADVVMGRFRGGEALFDAANGGIGLAPFHDAAAAVPAEVQARLIETLEALASGRLSTGVAPATGD